MNTGPKLDAQEATPQESAGGSTRRATVLAWGAFAWTIVAGTVLAFAQTGESVSVSSTSNSATTEVVYSTTSLLESDGWSVVPVLLVPVALAAIGLVGRGRWARRRRLIAAGVLAVCCVLGMMTIGLFYVPAAILLLLAGRSTPVVNSSRQATQPVGSR